ncbi:MAG: M28 family peptidase [Bacteroidales bacterium]|nr:M28 family peptidase [Bacteroidales bacterium]
MRNVLVALLITSTCFAQDTLLWHYSKTITGEELSTHVYTLASDEMEGRFTGSRGLIKAQSYITGEFKEAGLEMPWIDSNRTYSQTFVLDQCRWKDQRLALNGEEFRVGKDFLFLSDPVDIRGDFPVIFAGFGIDDSLYSDFEGIDITGQIMLAFAGEPADEEGRSLISGKKEISKKGYYFSKEAEAAERGAEGVFIISRKRSDYKEFLRNRKYYDPRPNISYPGHDDDEFKERKQAFSAYMNMKTAARIVDQKPKSLLAALEEMGSAGKTASGRFRGRVSIEASSDCLTLQTANVIGLVEGTEMKDQAVVVVAHYDHLGKDHKGIYYGADDNASGTAALMEVAEAFTLAAREGYRPRRTVVFLAASAEELGLYGSKFYTQNPLVPLDSTFACVNIDMIGRAATRLADSPDYISGYAYISPDILEVHRSGAGLAAPDLEDRMEFRAHLRGGSDHYYFARHGIPSLFYFTGFHADYHETTDTPDKILYGRMEKIARAIFITTWELANREEGLETGN